jgi:uroporphyrin-3 C-methyltransferase
MRWSLPRRRSKALPRIDAPVSTEPTPDLLPAPPPATLPRSRRGFWVAVVLAAVAAIAIALAWDTRSRVRSLERELVRRQDASQRDAAEAQAAAKAARDLAADAVAKAGLLEARVADAAMQRSQVEELLQSVARSRDENVVADVEAAIRVALQQSAITGSAEPLLATLRQAEERLARYNQPRLERVRRAVARDLDRVKAQGAVDISSLTVRLDEAVRLVDELPLLAVAVVPDAKGARAPARAAAASAQSTAASAAATPASASGWSARAAAWWHTFTASAGDELRALLRVTRIDAPEAALIAPDQQFFVRENLKLRLLNARLALFARQFEIAQADLRDAQAVLDRYFDRSSKRVIAAHDALRQVQAQSRQGPLPRPDETLAALATAAAGR